MTLLALLAHAEQCKYCIEFYSHCQDVLWIIFSFICNGKYIHYYQSGETWGRCWESYKKNCRRNTAFFAL